MILLAGALLGFIGVAFGAYAEHGLRAELSQEVFHSISTAIRYNQWYAVVIASIGAVLLHPEMPRRYPGLIYAAWLFIGGTVLFSFSIYLSAVSGLQWLTRVTPFGGVILMVAWLVLAWTGVRSHARRTRG